MIRLTWRQFRIEGIAAWAALIFVAAVLAITGPHLVHLYDTTVANCQTQGDCSTATSTFLQNDHSLQTYLGPLVLIVPAIIGVFWGAPLVARELETGSFRLAWTQSVTRERWLAVKLGVMGLSSMAVAGLLSLAVTWWSRPVDKVNMNRFLPGVFDERGTVALGYAAFAFVLGVTTGALIRRTVPAMAVTLVAFIGTRLAVARWVRPHLMAPAHTSVPFSAGAGAGFSLTPSGVTVTVKVGIPNAWVLSNRIVDQAGHAAASTQSLHQFLQAVCPTIAAGPPPQTKGGERAAANPATARACLAQVAAKYHLVVTYQPANRFWAFQGIETAIYVALALALAGFCFWWVRHRLA